MKSKILKHHSQLKQASDVVQYLQQTIQSRLDHYYQNHAHANAIINDCATTAFAQVASLQFDRHNWLSGAIYSLKDNIVTNTNITTGGSLFLKDYVSPFNASVYEFLSQAGAINIAKANLDEFGLGGKGIYSAFGVVKNPHNNDYLIGGSSSGSAYLVASDIVDFAIATDTGDSIRLPASYAGIVGFKPSYGAISRYGVYPFCPSLDTVGIMAKSVIDTWLVFNQIAQQDQFDSTNWAFADKLTNLEQFIQPRQFKIAIFKNIFDHEEYAADLWMHQVMVKQFQQLIDQLESDHNLSIAWIDFAQNHLDILESLYTVTAYSESLSCYANLTGLTFGPQLEADDVWEKIKSARQLFGTEFNKRLLIGGVVSNRDNYHKIYLKSKQIRSHLQPMIEQLFAEYDAVLLPGFFGIAPTFSDLVDHNIDVPKNNIVKALKIANFFGLPSITIPWTKLNQMPVGLNIMAGFKNDYTALKLAYYLVTKIKELERE